MSNLLDLYNKMAAHEVDAPHNACVGCVNFADYNGRFVCNCCRDLSQGMPQHCDMYDDGSDDDGEEDF